MPKHEEHQETFCTLLKGSIKKHEMCLFPFLLCCITDADTKTGESERDITWIISGLGQPAYFVVL